MALSVRTWISLGTAAALGGWLGVGFFKQGGAAAGALLPGPSTSGHHQIQLKCSECHTPWNGVRQDACTRCHEAQLTIANDSHPKSKFTDPRNAERVAAIDATRCVTCHKEHAPAETGLVGLTRPKDFCFQCHQDIAKDRPTHQGLSFESCSARGCHNFHDNRALYEGFVAKHLEDKDVRADAKVPERNTSKIVRELLTAVPAKAITAVHHDAPAAANAAHGVGSFETTVHAQAGVNCTQCHGGPSSWVAKPDHTSCQKCHTEEVAGFLHGKHGMRLAAGLGPMTPALARLPMKTSAAGASLSCSSCHGEHKMDTQAASATACLTCHDDGHSRGWETSTHGKLWKAELAGTLPKGSGVSCATCHLPRAEAKTTTDALANALLSGAKVPAREVLRVSVQHDQNDNLRPASKMVRSVCLSCHGLAFSLDALADPELVARNFTGKTGKRVDTVAMVRTRKAAEQAKKTEPKQEAK